MHPPYSLPIPTQANKQQIHAFAEAAAKKLSYVSGGPIRDVVTKLGGTTEHSDPFEVDIPDSIRVEKKGRFTIYISSLTSSERDRFTIAHELGHYLLHFPKLLKDDPSARMLATRWVNESKADQVRAEWEANWFAAAFLMPKAEFEAAHAKYTGDLSKIATAFGVSEAAATIRAKSLGLS